jgi:hypothetical protein
MKTKMKIISSNSKYILPAIILVFFFAGCKVPYDPTLKTAGDRFLIVEGFINVNGVSTNIKLSRTRNVTKGDTASNINETGANVAIEDNQNNLYPLNETGDGNYSASYTLSPANQYRLHITTGNQEEYRSDFVKVKEAPPIDDLGWKFKYGDVQVFVNTHDPSNQTTYYRWDYKETWEFHSEYYSTLMYDAPNVQVVDRSVPVYVCYRSKNSTNIFLGSTAKLQQDIIHEAPLSLIPYHDKRISVLYSIDVTQYALDPSAYKYWSSLKENTENVGSIFGQQPGKNVGNIHSIADPFERVIGYISAGSTQQARLFISDSSMPADWNQKGNCDYIEVPPIKDSLGFYFGVQGFVPIKAHLNGIIVLGYFASEGPCVDCTINGTTQKPGFWP